MQIVECDHCYYYDDCSSSKSDLRQSLQNHWLTCSDKHNYRKMRASISSRDDSQLPSMYRFLKPFINNKLNIDLSNVQQCKYALFVNIHRLIRIAVYNLYRDGWAL